MTKYKSPPGTWVEREMFESTAFLALKGFSPQLLILILGKRQFVTHGNKGKQKRICTNCDKINITYTEFKNEYGITQPRMTRSIDQLLAKGFLSIVNPGGTYKQDKAIYALSTNWVIWHPGMVFESREREGVERGFCNPKK
jgi:hypothetical protein